MIAATQSFLLALSALFSIVNPIGMALIFSQVTADRTHAERTELAWRIALYAGLIMLGALWVGTYVLNFFGISMSALRVAGGTVIAISAWTLLNKPEQNDQRKQEQASQAAGIQDVAFFPLTMPFTTGPGTIAVAIAIGSNGPNGRPGFLPFFIGVSAAAVAVAGSVLLAYASADRLVALLGHARSQIVTRLSAFLMLCVGVQIAMNGLADFFRTSMAGLPPV